MVIENTAEDAVNQQEENATTPANATTPEDLEKYAARAQRMIGRWVSSSFDPMKSK